MTHASLATAYIRAHIACLHHAATCRACCYPIIDAQGNPGILAESCATGAPLLRTYITLESDLFSMSPAERDRALADSALATLEERLS